MTTPLRAARVRSRIGVIGCVPGCVAGAAVGLALGCAAKPTLVEASALDPRGQLSLPAAAAEGYRDLPATERTLRSAVLATPFGKAWVDLVKTPPPPAPSPSIAQAQTHPDLKHDPIELSTQTRYREETGLDVRYGWVSVRLARLFKYGRLDRLELILDQIQRGDSTQGVGGGPSFASDLHALRGVLKDPVAALALGPGFRCVRNDLTDPAKAGALPLSVEIEPTADTR